MCTFQVLWLAVMPRPATSMSQAELLNIIPEPTSHKLSRMLLSLLFRTQRLRVPAGLVMATGQAQPASSMQKSLTMTFESLGLNPQASLFNTDSRTCNPLEIYRAHTATALSPVVGVPPEKIQPVLQRPVSLDKGDLTLPVAALRLKDKKPAQHAKEIAAEFPSDKLIEVQNDGDDSPFLKISFKAQPLHQIVLPAIMNAQESYGFNSDLGLRDPSNPSSGRKTIIVEFSSPNMAKPFHAGHLRSTIIGGFLANLYEKSGWNVIRMNYLGDWGKQYGVLAVGFEKYGNNSELVQNPIGHLYNVYVQINKDQEKRDEDIKSKENDIKKLKDENKDSSALEQEVESLKESSVDERARRYFKRMVDGDEEAVATWRKFRDLSIEKYKQTYARLNIQYDEYSGESMVTNDSMEKAARILEEEQVSEVSQGATIVDLSKHGAKKLGKTLVKKKDGTSLYLTRDLGAMMQREEKYHFDKMLYVIANQQDQYVAQLFKIVELMGFKDMASRCQHISFGMVLGMSTRRGTAKFLDDILHDVGEKMHEVMRTNEDKYKQVEDPEKVADTLGISAVMVQDMTGKRVNNYHFDMDRMTSFEGDTGPYLQYAHARLCSITRKAEMTLEELADADYSLLTERHAIDLARSLAQWPDVVQNTIKTHEPITVLTYLFKMTHTLSASYDHLQVVGSEAGVKKARLALYTCARQTLWNGMRLLGLSPVERM